MPTDIAKYSIELFKPGGESSGIEDIYTVVGVAAATGATTTLIGIGVQHTF